jgi:hypothetical protein
MKIQEYDVVSTDNLNHLKASVNVLLESGWTLMGGISTASSGSYGIMFTQALVRYTEAQTP